MGHILKLVHVGLSHLWHLETLAAKLFSDGSKDLFTLEFTAKAEISAYFIQCEISSLLYGQLLVNISCHYMENFVPKLSFVPG